MLDDDKLYQLLEPIIDTVRTIEMEMLLDLAKRFNLNDNVGGTMEWKLKQLEQMGLLHEENIAVIAKYSNRTTEYIKTAIRDAGISALDMDGMIKAFDKGLASVDPRTISLEPVITTFEKQITKEFRMITTNAVTGANKQYQNIIEQVSLEVVGGFKSYQEAISDSFKALAKKGITSTTYKGINKNGEPYLIEYPLEASVRRSVMMAMNSVANATNELMIDELKPPQIATSQHLGARSTGIGHENHSQWQGRAFDNDGTFEKETGYNNPDMQGLGGYGCRHFHYAYYEGISASLEPLIDGKENDKHYELSQKQRALENNLRNARKFLDMAKITDDPTMIEKGKEEVDKRLNKLSSFVRENNLTRQYARERISEKYKDKAA